LNYKWNEHAEGYGSVMLMDDQTDAQIAPSGDFGNSLYINCDNPMLSADQYQKICTNAGYGPGIMGPDGIVGDAGLQILRRNVEGGGRMDKLSHQSFRLVGGVKGELVKGWNYDVYGLDAVTRVPETYLNDFNTQNIQNALMIQGTPGDPSTWHCRDGNAVAAGCVPWNIFKAGGVTQAALNYLLLPLVSTTDLKTQVMSAKVNADLKEYGLVIPSAVEGISIALGTEYRRETLDYQTDLAYQQGWGAGQGSTQLPVVGFYSVKEAFLETVIPVVQGARGAQNLTLNLGYRYSDYNVNGSHPSWKAEGAWSPDNSFKFRVGVNRATRAPNVVELFQSRSLALGGSTDPCSGATPQFTAAQCANLHVSAAQYGNIQPNSASQYNTYTGGNPNLNPEVADTKTLGVVMTPSGLPGFTAALDYYDIKLTDAIGALGADDILKQCGLTGNPVLCNLVHRDQFGSLWRTPAGYTQATNANIGKRHTEGIDANISYTLPAGNSIFTFNLIGSYLMKSQINTGLYQYDCVGWYGNICNDPYSDHINMQPKWRHMFRATWEAGHASFSLGWRMIGEMTAEEASSQSALANPDVIPQLKLNHAYHYPAYNYIDLAVSYKLKNHVQFTFGVNNIADKEPPLGANSSANDYGPGFYGTYDAYGRFIHSSIQFSF
ncbi:MAG: TonB-dependent receptor, partial [Acidobacteria bacterium]